jgi:hypothetical protein
LRKLFVVFILLASLFFNRARVQKKPSSKEEEGIGNIPRRFDYLLPLSRS